MPFARDVVDARHRHRQRALADAVGAMLTSMLAALPTLEQDDVERYTAAAFPVVAGGQHAAADTAAAYASVLAAGRRPKRPVAVEAALGRSGVLVGADSRSIVAPVLRARHLTAEGQAMPTALKTAAGYATQLSGADLQAAMRVGVDEGAQASGLSVQGWRKGLSGDACEWCQLIADNVYGSPDDVPFHAGDKCGVEPELDEQAPSRFDDSDIPF